MWGLCDKGQPGTKALVTTYKGWKALFASFGDKLKHTDADKGISFCQVKHDGRSFLRGTAVTPITTFAFASDESILPNDHAEFAKFGEGFGWGVLSIRARTHA